MNSSPRVFLESRFSFDYVITRRASAEPPFFLVSDVLQLFSTLLVRKIGLPYLIDCQYFVGGMTMAGMDSVETPVLSAAVRPPAVSGMFYPDDPRVLQREVEHMIGSNTIVHEGEQPVGIVAPHAGYMYSGVTAGRAYCALRGRQFDVVVVIAPSHRDAFHGVTVYPGDAYATPLGKVPVAKEIRERLLTADGCVRASLDGHRDEHAVEVQLPFLQVALGEFSFVPLVMGDQRTPAVNALGALLGKTLEGVRALIVASTDLSHYLPAKAAEHLDHVARADIDKFDPDGLMRHLNDGSTEACGGGPTVATMKALRHLGASRFEVVHHSTSGDTTGDQRSVVGYCSAVAWKAVKDDA